MPKAKQTSNPAKLSVPTDRQMLEWISFHLVSSYALHPANRRKPGFVPGESKVVVTATAAEGEADATWSAASTGATHADAFIAAVQLAMLEFVGRSPNAKIERRRCKRYGFTFDPSKSRS